MKKKKRLDYLKPNNENFDDFAIPKKANAKQVYEPQSMPDVDFNKNADDSRFEMNDQTSSRFNVDHTTLFDIEMAGGKDKATAEHEAEHDPFSVKKNRWKRTKDIPDDNFDDHEW